MKKYFLILISLMTGLSAEAQKPAIGLNDLTIPWSGATASVSNDGNYVMTTMYNVADKGISPLNFLSTHDSWKMEIPGADAYTATFTQDSRMAFFMLPGDSLGVLRLGELSVQYLPGVSSFKLPKEGAGEWIAYQLTTPQKEVVLQNLVTGTIARYDLVKNYQFSDNGKVLLLQTAAELGKEDSTALVWVNLAEGKRTTIWTGKGAGSFLFDGEANQLAFTMDEKANGQVVHSFWYYKQGMDKAVLLADNHTAGIDSGLRLDDMKRFSKDGSRLFFHLKEQPFPKMPPDAVKVNVWSYRDPKLQSEQLYYLTDHGWDGGGPEKYLAVMDINGRRIIRLEQKGDQMQGYRGDNDDYELMVHTNGGDAINEWNWNKTARSSVYLVSVKDGSRKLILPDYPTGFYGSPTPALSPSGKYIVYYNPKQKNYFSYDIASGTVRNITKGIQTIWTTYFRKDVPVAAYNAIGVAGWLRGDAAVLLYDQHDIWKIDLAGKASPVNLTNGYGYRHDIIFQPVCDLWSGNTSSDAKLFLNAFNQRNKEDGFYSIDLNKRGDPQLLTMQPYLFGGIYGPDNLNQTPVAKARDADMYLVQRQSAAESPNYFLSSDLKTFKQITFVYPEKKYNWMTSELITWKTLDGQTSQGILYKPENFDPKKKYPVIFTYYELSSDGLHEFQRAGLTGGPLAWSLGYYVSDGYLVFMPDIHSKVGHPGQAAYNSIVSAAKYVAKLPFVDAKHIGIQGQSFGGFETDYLITHTSLFAAACSTSGMTDFVSAYGSLIGDGSVRQRQYELYRDRIGASLWQRPDLYIENSPVFKADKVTTPLLMMANPEDGDVPYPQGVEFFTALRRLGKTVWMLQYDGEGHMLGDDKNEKDLTLRMKQFFDYYLKGSPAPEWMVKGIPAKMKGIDNGYELEPAGVDPGPGLLIGGLSTTGAVR